MFKLPDFFDQLNGHLQQMLLAHAAMYEDICSVAHAHMGEYFREPNRTTSFYAEGLAWSIQAMASHAAERLQHAVISQHLREFDSGSDRHDYMQGVDGGHVQLAYGIIRSGYQALRSHGMRAKKRSEHWDKVEPYYLQLYWDIRPGLPVVE